MISIIHRVTFQHGIAASKIMIHQTLISVCEVLLYSVAKWSLFEVQLNRFYPAMKAVILTISFNLNQSFDHKAGDDVENHELVEKWNLMHFIITVSNHIKFFFAVLNRILTWRLSSQEKSIINHKMYLFLFSAV